MPDGPKLVPLHARPPLTDVAARLRLLADDIEAGRHGRITTAFVVLPQAGDYPSMFGFGDIEGDNNIVQQLELAKLNYLINVMVRS